MAYPCSSCSIVRTAAPAYETRLAAAGATLSLEMEFTYPDGRYFRLRADFAWAWAVFESNLGAGLQTLPITTGLLTTEAALGEAIFY